MRLAITAISWRAYDFTQSSWSTFHCFQKTRTWISECRSLVGLRRELWEDHTISSRAYYAIAAWSGRECGGHVKSRVHCLSGTWETNASVSPVSDDVYTLILRKAVSLRAICWLVFPGTCPYRTVPTYYYNSPVPAIPLSWSLRHRHSLLLSLTTQRQVSLFVSLSLSDAPLSAPTLPWLPAFQWQVPLQWTARTARWSGQQRQVVGWLTVDNAVATLVHWWRTRVNGRER